ncbi:MAG: excinuclease ABC subunit UvrC [Ruminococcaceae bacterium]|nr:excinuclease ABC subunit UvrC [Oscillospiraceae bacterium]
MKRMAQNIEYLLEKALSLPLSPGVYIMRDESRKVIYVGKSRALKNRVSQYFRKNSKHDKKTIFMVSKVRDFDYMLTDTENEALALESQLIKQYSPKYNIKLKDGKNAPYIRIQMNDEYPKAEVVYSRKNDGAKYFGPYSTISSAYGVLKTVQKCFKVHSCNRRFPKDIGKDRPCLYCQIGDCVGPCTGKISSDEYREIYKQIVLFLRGSFTEVKKRLTEKMELFSENLRFEEAAVYRDRIEALAKVWQRHKIVGSPDAEHDVFALYTDDAVSCMVVFFVREGRITNSEHYIFTPDELLSTEDLQSFLYDFYAKRGDVPRELLLSFDLGEDRIGLEESLRLIAERKVVVKTPERGEYKKLCDMVYENAARHAYQYKEGREADESILVKLAQMLQLEVVPERIESFDISNYGKENITAGMVVAENGRMKKSEYRLFKIKGLSDKQDDYSAMAEAVRRRFERAKQGDEGFSVLPDLILLDGGKGHVSVIKEVLSNMEVDVPVFGMAKDDYHKTRTLCDEENEISIAKEKQVYMLVYKIQEEVHRFTISKMRASKEKSLKKSVLEEIDGIGKEKAKKILAHFKSLSALKKASLDEIKCVKGISDKNAEAVFDYFCDKGENDL